MRIHSIMFVIKLYVLLLSTLTGHGGQPDHDSYLVKLKQLKVFELQDSFIIV